MQFPEAESLFRSGEDISQPWNQHIYGARMARDRRRLASGSLINSAWRRSNFRLRFSCSQMSAARQMFMDRHMTSGFATLGRRERKGVDEIVIFSVGSRSAVSILGEENFILAKNLPLHGTKPGSSLLSLEELLGCSSSGHAF